MIEIANEFETLFFILIKEAVMVRCEATSCGKYLLTLSDCVSMAPQHVAVIVFVVVVHMP